MPLKTLPKPYFPMVLANGADVVLVDYSGSMHCDSGHCHLEQHQDAHAGWQKTSHREKGRRLFTVAFFPYRVMKHDGDLYEVGDFVQRFDPLTATLVTEVKTHILHLRITAFLADGQPLYAERFEVLWTAPGTDPRVALLGRQMALPEQAQVTFQPAEGARFAGTYTFSEHTGALAAVVVTDRPVVTETQPHIGWIEVRDLRPGDVFARFVTMQDTSHTAEPAQACRATLEAALAAGFEAVHAAHARAWESYHAHTHVELPDLAMDYQYRLSLYLLRASQHPSGFVTHGIYDVLWGGGTACTWDLTGFVRAWATANQRQPVQALLDFYQHGAEPMARTYAQQLGQPGVNYPWFLNVFGRDLFFSDAVAARGVQKWNMCCMALQFFDVFRYFGDVDDLRTRLPILKDTLDFLLAEIVVREPDRWYVGKIEGADENIDRENDTAHLLPLIKGLQGYQEGCRRLGMPEDADYAEAIVRLSQGLRENCRRGILYPYRGSTEVSTINTALYALNMPEGIPAASIRATYRNSRTPWGLTNDNSGQYPNLVWPWQEVFTAVAFSSVDPKLSFRWLRHVITVTDTHGLFPEKIRPDGFWIFLGYGSPHAVFVWALNSVLATDNGETLTIAAGLPAAWTDYAFTDIRTPSGYAVTLQMRDGRLTRLTITNSRPEARTMRLRLLPAGHVDARDDVVTLEPGETVVV